MSEISNKEISKNLLCVSDYKHSKQQKHPAEAVSTFSSFLHFSITLRQLVLKIVPSTESGPYLLNRTVFYD